MEAWEIKLAALNIFTAMQLNMISVKEAEQRLSELKIK